MEKLNKPILVPWDFSQVAEYALEHAVHLANLIDSDVNLVHIVKGKKEVEEATEKMNKIADDCLKKFNVKPDFFVRVGTIFKTINEVSDEISANFVIMGTHGMKGMQKILGSWALKVIAGSKAPFVVVQAPPKREQYKSIVFPVDFKIENKEKLRWVQYLAKLYHTKIEICKPNITDALMKKRTTANLLFAKKFFDDKGIDYEISTVEGEGDFADETIKFAEKKNADLIIIMTTKRISFQDYVLGAAEQNIISNDARIPVMCVNPRTDLRKPSLFN